MIAVSSWKIGESHPGLGYSLYFKYQVVIAKAVLEGISTSEILQKDKNFTPSVVQLHISKLYSSQLPEGFAETHLLSSCTLFSKLCPGSKTSHLRPGFQSALKSTGISNMFWKLLHLTRARGNIIHAGLKSVGLTGLQIIPFLFNLPRRTAFYMLGNPLGYDDCLENLVVTITVEHFTVNLE